jgi:hypothetical protein
MGRRAALVAVLALAAACSSGDERAAGRQSHPRDAELRRLIGRTLEMHDGLAEAASRAGRDCAAMARGFTAVIEAHRDVLGPADIDTDPALRERFDQLLDDEGKRQAAWAERFARAVAPCVADRQVGAALAPLEEGDRLRAD